MIKLRAVIQRVKSSSVEVSGNIIGKIDAGLNVLLGITQEDTEEDLRYIKDKIINLRIFEDEDLKMNKSLLDVNGQLLIISQFTLYGDCRKGRRPNFMKALSSNEAKNLYDKFLAMCRDEVAVVEAGEFGAYMNVQIENDGPVTLLIDSKKTF
ncbi:D-tyrosyl-tRNA(Tyr) deacylase [Clostridium acidisoli DSM 12555]|uniref:D-aminoacyl-tRNA deacylase n=1 Tax=Clostridium acidisoli DSM 12555 TaxID=1121291 RepID=A0A1W1XBN5_9CLOT|nr:D-tyrosyl-tRNA(Tyr) deacylase [Clostridium acidisoli DSM 12555]